MTTLQELAKKYLDQWNKTKSWDKKLAVLAEHTSRHNRLRVSEMEKKHVKELTNVKK